MSRAEHVRRMADYNAWMNDRLYAAAMQLSDAELALDRKAFFGSIIGTLNHLVVADTIWLKRFLNHPARFAALEPMRALPTPSALNETLETDIRRLAERRRQLDQAIVDWAGAVTEADLDQSLAYASMKGVPGRRNFFAVAMHVFNHQTHHRGQTTTLLHQAGIDMGVTDLIVRVPDLDAV